MIDYAIKIETFIKSEEEYINIFDYNSEIHDPDYLEGSIELKIYGKEIISKYIYDYIDELWAYIINGLEDIILNNKKECSTNFPDQSIELRFSLINGDRDIKISLNLGNADKKIISSVIGKNI